MKVSDLIALLQKEDPNRIVIMSTDGEGNYYSPLSSADTCAYRAETTWSGEVGLEEPTEEDKRSGYSEEDVLEGGEPALVLYPTN